MSVERVSRRLVRGVVFWRAVGALVSIPRHVCQTLAGFCTRLGAVFAELEYGALYLELESMRRHKLLTDSDLGVAAGEPHRYSGLSSEAAAAVEDRLVRRAEDL